MMLNPHMLPKMRSQPLLDAIRGMPCALRVASFIPGHQCAHISTVVPCHVAIDGRGVATKGSDLFVAAGCIHCHDLIDRRDSRWTYLMDHYPAAVMSRVLAGMQETQARLVAAGIITVKGAIEIKGVA